MSAQALRYKNQGNEEFKKGNHAKAIEYYTYATELDPSNHLFFTNRATAYFKMGRFDRALRDAEKSIRLNNRWWKGYMKKAESLEKLERFEEAENAAKQGSQMFSDHQASFDRLAARCRSARMRGMSTAEIEKIQGNDAFKAGNQEQAIKHYTNALRACETKTEEGREMAAAILANRAACNRQLYMHKKVVEDCTQALAYKPGYLKAFIRRAQSYESLEKYRESLADYEQAVALGGGLEATRGASRVRQGLRQLEAYEKKQAQKGNRR